MSTVMRQLTVCRQCLNLVSAGTKLQPNGLLSKSTQKRLLAGFRVYSSKTNPKGSDGATSIPWWVRLGLVSGVAGAAYYMKYRIDHMKDLDNEEERYVEFKKINFGGEFSLDDQDGKRRSSKEFRGQWMLIYFGFTHCPDICPEELDKLGEVVQMFEEDPKLPKLQPIFITLDPERDTSAVIKGYLKGFKSLPTIVGFTASIEELKDLSKRFRVYFGQGERDENNDYIIDHSIITYLVNPEGTFVNYYGRAMTADQVKASITKHVNKYKEIKLKEAFASCK